VWEYLWKLKPKMIGSGLSYEMRVIRNVNRLYVGNLGPSGIGGTPSKYIYIYKGRGKKLLYFQLTWECCFYPEMGDVTIIVQSKDVLTGKVPVNNGSILNMLPRNMLKEISIDESHMRPSTRIARVYDGSPR